MQRRQESLDSSSIQQQQQQQTAKTKSNRLAPFKRSTTINVAGGSLQDLKEAHHNSSSSGNNNNKPASWSRLKPTPDLATQTRQRAFTAISGNSKGRGMSSSARRMFQAGSAGLLLAQNQHISQLSIHSQSSSQPVDIFPDQQLASIFAMTSHQQQQHHHQISSSKPSQQQQQLHHQDYQTPTSGAGNFGAGHAAGLSLAGQQQQQHGGSITNIAASSYSSAHRAGLDGSSNSAISSEQLANDQERADRPSCLQIMRKLFFSLLLGIIIAICWVLIIHTLKWIAIRGNEFAIQNQHNEQQIAHRSSSSPAPQLAVHLHHGGQQSRATRAAAALMIMESAQIEQQQQQQQAERQSSVQQLNQTPPSSQLLKQKISHQQHNHNHNHNHHRRREAKSLPPPPPGLVRRQVSPRNGDNGTNDDDDADNDSDEDDSDDPLAQPQANSHQRPSIAVSGGQDDPSSSSEHEGTAATTTSPQPHNQRGASRLNNKDRKRQPQQQISSTTTTTTTKPSTTTTDPDWSSAPAASSPTDDISSSSSSAAAATAGSPSADDGLVEATELVDRPTPAASTAIIVVGLPYKAPFFTSWFVSTWNILFMPVFTLISSCCFRNEDSNTKKLLVRESISQFMDNGLTTLQFLGRCAFFSVLWIGTIFGIVYSLYNLDATLVMALFACSATLVYLLSWVLLHQQFVGVRIVAVIICTTGIALLAYMDNSRTLGSVLMVAGSALCSAVYKVIYQRMFGFWSIAQMSLFFTLIGLFNAFLMWPIALLLYFLGVELIVWRYIPWMHLTAAGALHLSANILAYFGPICSYDIFLTLGLLFAVILSAAIDVNFYKINFEGMKLAGVLLLMIGFLVCLLPENWNEFLYDQVNERFIRWKKQRSIKKSRNKVQDLSTGQTSRLRTPSGRVK